MVYFVGQEYQAAQNKNNKNAHRDLHKFEAKVDEIFCHARRIIPTKVSKLQNTNNTFFFFLLHIRIDWILLNFLLYLSRQLYKLQQYSSWIIFFYTSNNFIIYVLKSIKDMLSTTLFLYNSNSRFYAPASVLLKMINI